MAIDAANIMSEDLTTFSPVDRVKSVHKEMDEESFDYAPIEAGGVIRQFIKKSDLEEADPTEQVRERSRAIEEKHIVGSEVPVVRADSDTRNLVEIMDNRDMEFVFVVNNGIDGIISHADFNHVRAGIPLYHLISEYEAKISDLITDEIPHDRWLDSFDEETEKKIKDLYHEEAEENAELRLVDCLNTRNLHQVLFEYDLWTKLGIGEETEVEDTFEAIEKLRNDVMHQRPVVGENSFQEFAQIVSDLHEINQVLESSRE